MWYAFGRASDLGYIQKCNLSVCSDNVLFLRFIRTKTSEEQGLSLIPDHESYVTCPLHAIGMALAMQTYPGEPLLDLPQLSSGDEEVPSSITEGIPLVEALLAPSEDNNRADVPTQEQHQGPAALRIHAYVNRIVKSISKIQAKANPTSNLSSHSFRRGGAQHANSDATLTAQWIFARGSWNMTATNKAFAYVFNTTSEDQKVSRVLSGWKSSDAPRIPSIDIFDSSTRERITKPGKTLFASSICLNDRTFKLDNAVVDLLTASLIQYFPQVNERYPMSPYCSRVRACMYALNIRGPDIASWSTELARWSSQQNSERNMHHEEKLTQEMKLINHQNCVISELIKTNRELAGRVALLESRQDGRSNQDDAAGCSLTHVQEATPQRIPDPKGRSSPKTASSFWFEWYTKIPRLWDVCASRQYKSMAKQIVAYMKLFLPQGFKIDPTSSNYCDDVFATGNLAEANLLQFLKSHSMKRNTDLQCSSHCARYTRKAR